METTPTVSRTHPLIIAAALAVITVSAAGTAALFGLLPAHKADTAPLAVSSQQTIGSQQAFEAQQGQSNFVPGPAAQAGGYEVAPAPKTQLAQYREQPLPREEADEPAPRKAAAKPHHAAKHHHDAPVQAAAPAQKSGPNYVAIGTGAVIGGVLGHQVGGGNGKKLATVAGVIGGGLIGNEIANRNK